jgi:hypothetical protein
MKILPDKSSWKNVLLDKNRNDVKYYFKTIILLYATQALRNCMPLYVPTVTLTKLAVQLIFLCLTLDNFTCQGESAGTQWVNQNRGV